MSETAHLYRLVQDQKTGRLLPGVTVTLANPGTTSPISAALYSDEALTQQMSNPFVAQDGIIDVYLPNPQNVALLTTYGGVTTTADETPVLPDASLLLVSPTPITITNGPGTNYFLQGIDNATVQWADLTTVFPALESTVIGWALSQAFAINSCTRDTNGALLTADVTWPDNTSGVYTADTVSTAFPGLVDAWHVTYDGSTAWTLTQSAVTRDTTTGSILTQPVLVVS